MKQMNKAANDEMWAPSSLAKDPNFKKKTYSQARWHLLLIAALERQRQVDQGQTWLHNDTLSQRNKNTQPFLYYLCAHIRRCQQRQKDSVRSLELELWVAMSCLMGVLGTKLESSGKVASTLSHWVVSLAPWLSEYPGGKGNGQVRTNSCHFLEE